MSKPPRLPLRSAIPDGHPFKIPIEEACQSLLDDLGPGWGITISRDSGQGKWGVTVRRQRDGKTYMRTWTLSALDRNMLERRIRDATREIRQESNLQFGMMPIGNLTERGVVEVLDLVGMYGGRLHPDGWITLPDHKAWGAFLDRAKELGVTLAASVREG